MRKLIKLGLFITIIFVIGSNLHAPSGYATYNEWLECTGKLDTEANYKYYLSEVEKLDY